MLDRLDTLEREALAELETTDDSETLHAWEVRYLGKKGQVTQILRSVGELPHDERPAAAMSTPPCTRTLP